MTSHPRIMRLHAARPDLSALRRFFEESLLLPVSAQDATSISYAARDAVLVVDWTLDHAAAAADDDPRRDVVLLVDELDAVRGALSGCGVRCDPCATGATFAGSDGPRFVLLDISDECLMWPSVGWRAGPSAVVRTPPRSAP
ncbi:hypothetical protein [Actinoplanes sp. NPDC051859]|uniref:hypothetical protein n=1 Tax=Actinoplanes sp. NPDC051859 TaxID=3363909 RepID=UPI00379F945A